MGDRSGRVPHQRTPCLPNPVASLQTKSTSSATAKAKSAEVDVVDLCDTDDDEVCSNGGKENVPPLPVVTDP